MFPHRIYAVGDVHGRADLLNGLLSRIIDDAADFPGSKSLIFVGDYIDRGPESKEVIERLLTPPEGFETHCLRGNHDQALLDFLEDSSTYRLWKKFGAAETLMSYGVIPPHGFTDAELETTRDEFAAQLPEAHLEFFRLLAPYVQIEDYHFVHAGVRPGVALEEQSLHDMMWIREEFLDSLEDFGKLIIHGHTPTDRPVCRANRIGIDTRAYDSHCLTALVLEQGGAMRFLST